jgi:hypothetical protein
LSSSEARGVDFLLALPDEGEHLPSQVAFGGADYKPDGLPLPARISQDVELGHALKGREFVAEQAVLPMEGVEPIDDLIHDDIFRPTLGPLACDEVPQKIL